MRSVGPIVLALTFALCAPAWATGSVRIQQRNGTVQMYTGVTFKVANNALTLISADKFSKVVVSGGDCAPEGDIVRCMGGGMTLYQQGQRHAVAFKAATFYFNLTDEDQPLSLSTTKIAPHSVIFAVQTAKGTYITGNGKLDQEPTP